MTLLVFGMDGAAREYIDKAIDRGLMPNMENLISDGFFGDLESTIPPTTIPAWVTMFSGKDPDTLGFYHMTDVDGDGDLRPVSSETWKGEMLWDRVEGRFDLINVPGTSPVWPVNGTMIEGFPMVTQPSAYPEKWEKELEKMDLRDPSETDTDRGSRRVYHHNFDERREVFPEIGTDPDVRIEVYQLTDTASHRCESEDQVLEGYRKMDEVLGEQMEKYEDVLVVSDHGFKQVDRYFYINTWLKNHGYLELYGGDGSSESGLLESLKSFLAGTPLKPYLKSLNDYVSSKTGRDFSPGNAGIEDIDTENSDAYSYRGGANSYADINLNDRSKKQEIREKLEEEDPVEEVIDGDDLYSGDESFPELVVKVQDRVGAGMKVTTNEVLRTKAFIHRRTGIIAGSGPSFRSTELETEYIADVAPTIAYYLGEDFDSDGTVLEEIFEDDFEPEKSSELSGIEV